MFPKLKTLNPKASLVPFHYHCTTSRYFVIALNNVEVVVIGKFNLPLSNYCNSFNSEGSGGNEMGAQENLQVKDVVALVSFLIYLLQINGFKYLWKRSPIVDNVLLGHLLMARNVSSKKCLVMGKR